MHQETPTVIHGGQSPFDGDGNFNVATAIDIAFEQRALGALDAADALELLADFFMTSQNYIFNSILAFEHEMASTTVPIILPGAPI